MPIKNLLLATFLGGLTLFVWGALYHTIIPFSGDAFLAFTNEDAVTQAIIANAPKSGMYFMPYVVQKSDTMTPEQLEAAKKAGEEKMERGPFMLASVRLGEMGSFGNFLLTQLITDILSAFLVCLVLVKANGMSYWNRVATVELIALAGFAAISLPKWNWYAFSAAFTTDELVEIGVGFFLAGLVIAKIISKTSEQVTA